MTIVLTFENGTTTTTNVSNSFTDALIQDCFVGNDFAGLGIVVSAVESLSTIY